jgi:hypothetical protein
MVASASPVTPVARPALRAPAPVEKEEAADEVAALLSGKPMPGTPVPPDRPFTVGAYSPVTPRSAFVPTGPANAPVPAAAAQASAPSPALVPLPPVRPSADGFRAASLSSGGSQPVAAVFAPPPRVRGL